MKQKIGVYICQCGSNISDYVNVEEVKEISEKIEGVFLAKTTMFACADSTQKEIIEDIKNNELDAIVVASCSPKLHLFTFRNVAMRAGLNQYEYVQVNLREQCSWAHSDNPKKATEKAIQLVKAGIEKARHSVALNTIKIESINSIIVIGAGVSGMRASIELAKMGTEVTLIEKEHFVGGRISQWNKLFTTDETSEEVISRLYKQIVENENIKLYTGAEMTSKSGSVGNFNTKISIKPRFINSDSQLDEKLVNEAIKICPIEVEDKFNYNYSKRKAIFKNHIGQYPEMPAINDDECNKCGECVKIIKEIDLDQKVKEIEINVGAILLTTGAESYEPKNGEFGYKVIDNIVTLQQFKRLVELNETELTFNNKKIKNIAYIYCVGSRQYDGENQYCSRFCCTAAVHAAISVKEKYKHINNFHFHRGIRTYGKQEILYNKSNKQGDIYLQFEDTPPEITNNNGKTSVKVNDFLTADKELEVIADLVVLVTGMIPRENSKIENILKVPIGRDKFYNEIHPKLRPVETVIDGVLISGACQAPLNITESVKSSLSAAAIANSLISKGEIELEPTLAKIDKSTCSWCDKCTDVCPYNAIVKIEREGKAVAEVIEANCKGCGMCLPVCPSNSIQLTGYTDVEIEGMIDALMS